MQIDPVEIFDLLNLLGLAGHWSYSDNFCNYFATLSRHGILDRDIPTRIVSDNAIVLEPQREVKLYQAVSDYVRHFYQLAQKENRDRLYPIYRHAGLSPR